MAESIGTLAFFLMTHHFFHKIVKLKHILVSTYTTVQTFGITLSFSDLIFYFLCV